MKKRVVSKNRFSGILVNQKFLMLVFLSLFALVGFFYFGITGFVTLDETTRETATISFDTTNLTNSTIDYGETTSFGFSLTNSTYSQSHTETITGLNPDTLYYYNITTCDSTGNCDEIGPFNFTTLDSPQFSSYWDDNATLTDSGTGNFNVTMTNTNGTVLLEIDGNNITATNLISNIYSASYVFSNSGVYSYRWHSWGDGTNKNYNVSAERSYTVNLTPDIVAPLVYLESPENNALNSVDPTPDFVFNVIDETSSTLDCTLWLDDGVLKAYGNIASVLNATSTTIVANATLDNANYDWNVKCYDSQGNQGSSLVRGLTMDYTAPPEEESAAPSNDAGGEIVTIPIDINMGTSETETTENITLKDSTIIEDFDLETGIKQIEVNVKNQVFDIGFKVQKYDSKPEEVANNLPENTGKIYKYLQIEPINLDENLELATVTFQVLKNWTDENNISKEDVVVYKFNETSEVWNELSTVFSEEDDDFYYYKVELSSFSYFAVVEKVPDEGSSDVEVDSEKSSWIWFIVGFVVLLGGLGASFWAKKFFEKGKR